MTPGSGPLKLMRVVFIFYALAVLIATHWPRLTLDVPGVERPDLLVHLSVFGIWTVLLNFSGLVGDPRSVRTGLRAMLVALVYAAIDESTQALPIVHRTAALDDYLANAGGIALATLALMVWRAWRGFRLVRRGNGRA